MHLAANLDHRLIRLLRQDARLSAAVLAQRLGTSRGTVQNRIDCMQASGVRAISTVEVRSSETAAVLAALRRMLDIGRIYATNGCWDLVAHINTDSLASLDRCLQSIGTLCAVTDPSSCFGPGCERRAARQRLGTTQPAFAAKFGVALQMLRKWEQGSRRPEGPARVLLRVIEQEPDAVRRALLVEAG